MSIDRQLLDAAIQTHKHCCQCNYNINLTENIIVLQMPVRPG